MNSRMLRIVTTVVLAIFLTSTLASACTTIMVGKKASVDGSVMVTHTCDG